MSATGKAPLLSGRLLVRNTVWNLVGIALPLVVALWAVPRLIHGMGAERFGLLSLVLLAVGYFSLFDLGVGRALTKLVAERLATGDTATLPSLIRTALLLMGGLGVVAALLVAALAPWLSGSVFSMSESLRAEALWTFLLLAGTLPFVISSAAFTGLLEAHQRFDRIAAVRVPLGVSNYVGPVLLLAYSQSLVVITAFLSVTRVLAWIAFALMSRGSARASTLSSPAFDRSAVRALLAFGGWITVSNVIGPVMVYFDRFLIGAALDLDAVAFYTTPYEVLTRLWVLPNALMGVLFPAFAAALASDSSRAVHVFRVSNAFLLCAMAVPVGLCVLFAGEGLTLWLGADFAARSTAVAQWLAVGVYINCVARLPFVAVQGHGRPDVTGKLHFAEALVFVPLLWVLVQRFGIVGAAFGWTLRIVVDTCALFLINARLVTVLRRESHRALWSALAATAALGLLAVPNGLTLKLVLALMLIVVSALFSLRFLRLSGRALPFIGGGKAEEVRGA